MRQHSPLPLVTLLVYVLHCILLNNGIWQSLLGSAFAALGSFLLRESGVRGGKMASEDEMLFILKTREEKKRIKRLEGKEEEWTCVVSSLGEELQALLCPAASGCPWFLPISPCKVASITSASVPDLTLHVSVSVCLSCSQSVRERGKELKSSDCVTYHLHGIV